MSASASPFAPHVLRVSGDGVPVHVEHYTDVMQSIRAIARNTVEGPSDRDVRAIAGEILRDAGIDGRSGHSIREKCQAFQNYVTGLAEDGKPRIVFAPDPIRKEFVVSAAGLLCLRKGFCLRIGDCDDVTGLLGALCESVGIITRILLVTFRPVKINGVEQEPQQHVLLGAKDERGDVLQLDGQHKDWIVGKSTNRNVANIVEFDPHEVHMNTMGQTSIPPAEIITLGAVPTVPIENVPHWDRASRAYWQRRNGALWRHDGEAWHPVKTAVGVGYVDAAGKPRELAWDGRRYWEKRRGRWHYQEGEAWKKVALDSPLVDELLRVVEAENAHPSSRASGDGSSAGVGASASAGGDANDPRGELAATQIREAVFTLRRSAIDLDSAFRSYIKTRSDLGLPAFEGATATVKGPNDVERDADGRIVWTPAVVEYCEWILAFADHLSAIANSALAQKRRVGFSATDDIQIELVPGDALRYALTGTPGARVIEFRNVDGDVVQWTMDENGQRAAAASSVGVGLAPILIGILVAAGVVTVVAMYFIVSKICDVLKAWIEEKTSSTIAEAVRKKQITPEEGARLLKADADRKAAIAAAEAARNQSDPFARVAEAAATVTKVLVIGGAVVGGAYLVSLAIPAFKAWRAGVPKTVPAASENRITRESTKLARRTTGTEEAMEEPTVRVFSPKREDGDTIDVRVTVSGGLAFVNGHALMVPKRSGRGYEPLGNSIDMWLSGGIINFLDSYPADVRSETVTRIADLAAIAAQEFDDADES